MDQNMEFEYNGQFINVSPSTLHQITAFQALWRGYHTRKLMRNVNEEFLELAVEIEEREARDLKQTTWFPPFSFLQSRQPTHDPPLPCSAKTDDFMVAGNVNPNKNVVSTLPGTGDIPAGSTNVASTLSNVDATLVRPALIIHGTPSAEPSETEIPTRDTGPKPSHNIHPAIATAQEPLINPDDRGTQGHFSTNTSEANRIDEDSEDTSIPEEIECEDTDENGERSSRSRSEEKKMADSAQGKAKTKRELLSERGQIAMELMWVQQAIASRKQYLDVKRQMSQGQN